MKITLEMEAPGTFGCPLLRAEDGREVLVQMDWDYPGIASSFGWEPCCGSGSTDGTIRCPDCGRDAGSMIAEALEYLRDHDGEEIEDPGYFD